MMRMRGAVAALAAALIVVGGPAAAAAPEPVAPEPVAPEPVAPEPVAPEPVAPEPADQARPLLEIPPPGANDWDCEPSPEHPKPVVLAHGLSGAAATNWVYLSPILADEGYCVFALTYGELAGLPPITGGFAPMEESAAEFSAFVDKVLAETGADQVDLVGHSEGTVMPQYYLKFLDGAPKVHRYVAITPLYDGTTLHSASEVLDRLATEVPGLGDLADELCASCRQLLHDSDFMNKLNEDGAAVPGIEYTTIMTKYDELVTPYTSGYLDSPSATNIVLQDVCPDDVAEHLAVIFDPNVARLVLNGLDPENAQPVECA